MDETSEIVSFRQASKLLDIDPVSMSTIIDASTIWTGEIGKIRYLTREGITQLRPLIEAWRTRPGSRKRVKKPRRVQAT